MALFISYSSQDRSTVDTLLAALRRAQQQVWFDQELGGGDSWWARILEQIRDCDVFIIALSSNWLQSKPSQSELRYAQALNRPILPVRIGDIGSMRVNPVAALQIVDYRNPTIDASIQLVTAVHSLTAKPQPLPDPLPDEPPVPFGYITRLGNKLAEKELSPQQQLELLVELRSGLDEDGDDPSARSDIAQLLRMLRMRHDVTYRTRNDIDNVLASIDSPETGSGAGPSGTADANAQAAATPTHAIAGPDGVSGPEISHQSAVQRVSAAQAGGSGTGEGSRKRLIIIGGAALAVVVAIVVAIVLVSPGSDQQRPAAPRAAGPAPAQPGPAAPSVADPAPTQPDPLDAILLGAPQVGIIMGVATMDIANQTQQMASAGQLSNPDCLGAFAPAQNAAYAGSGFTGVRGQSLHTGTDYRVYEAAVSFPATETAQAFVSAAAGKWKACAGSAVTLTTSDGIGRWTFGEFTGAAPKIALMRTRKDGNQCQRVLRAVSDVVLDILACAPSIQDQGSQIADQMANAVKQ